VCADAQGLDGVGGALERAPQALIRALDVLRGGEAAAVGGVERDSADYPRDKCIHELFEEQASQTPDGRGGA